VISLKYKLTKEIVMVHHNLPIGQVFSGPFRDIARHNISLRSWMPPSSWKVFV
jgi:hypothetical protein